MLSSHLVSDLERTCDYLVVLVASRVQLAGDLDTLLATHHRLTGRGATPPPSRPNEYVITESHTDRQTRCWSAPTRRSTTRLDREPAQPGGHRPGLHGPAPAQRSERPGDGGGPMIWLTWRQFRAQARWSTARWPLSPSFLADHRPQLAELGDPAGGFFDLLDQRRRCWSQLLGFVAVLALPASSASSGAPR